MNDDIEKNYSISYLTQSSKSIKYALFYMYNYIIFIFSASYT